MAIRSTMFARIAGTTLAALVLGTSVAAGATQAADTTAPLGAVGGLQSPVRGTLAFTVDAVDGDSGLATAVALVDGAEAARATLGTGCPPAADPQSPTQGCVHQVSGLPISIDLSAVAVGTHRLQVRVTDAAGNEATLFDGEFAVAGPDPVNVSTVTIAIGDQHAATKPPTTGGALTDQTTQPTPACLAPRLSMWLDQRPVRVAGRKPVLRASARYRFRGHLTCLVDGHRRSAPRGTPVDILSRVKKRTTAVTGATTTAKGRVTVILSYPSSRTLVFRYRSTAGSSTVRIPILVTKKAR